MIENESKLSATEAALLNAYIEGNLSSSKRNEVESLIASNERTAELFRRKKLLKEGLAQNIPSKKLSKESLSLIKAEVRGITEDLYPEEKKSLAEKIAKVLDTTVLEF